MKKGNGEMAKAITKPITAWAGFLDGKIDMIEIDTGFGGYGHETIPAPALFKHRTRAREEYADVRKVEIREIA